MGFKGAIARLAERHPEAVFQMGALHAPIQPWHTGHRRVRQRQGQQPAEQTEQNGQAVPGERRDQGADAIVWTIRMARRSVSDRLAIGCSVGLR